MQIKELRLWLKEAGRSFEIIEKTNKHLTDLEFMEAICNSLIVFIITRLGLGIVGHDLYEVYWWFASGLAIALLNINAIAAKRTNEIILIDQKA